MIIEDVFKNPVLHEISQLVSLLNLQRQEIMDVQKDILDKNKILSNHDLKFLFFISRSQRPTVRQLSGILGIKPSTVSIRLNNLEKLGFIKRVPDELDRRKKFIEMENKGSKVISNLNLLITMENNYFIKALNKLEDGDLDNLVILVGKLNTYLREQMNVDNVGLEMRAHLQQFLGFK